MPEYTYICSKCDFEIIIGKHKESPFKQPHIAKEENKLFECTGLMYRVWKPTTTFMSGVGYETDSPWE